MMNTASYTIRVDDSANGYDYMRETLKLIDGNIFVVDNISDIGVTKYILLNRRYISRQITNQKEYMLLDLIANNRDVVTQALKDIDANPKETIICGALVWRDSQPITIKLTISDW